jgi:hypothetical protein
MTVVSGSAEKSCPAYRFHRSVGVVTFSVRKPCTCWKYIFIHLRLKKQGDEASKELFSKHIDDNHREMSRRVGVGVYTSGLGRASLGLGAYFVKLGLGFY